VSGLPAGTAGRAARGALYLGAANWITYAANFAIAIVVARQLGPELFGVYAFAVAVNEFVNVVNGFAVAGALLQSREESEELHDTGYAMSMAQGLVGLLIALAVAPILWIHRAPIVAWFVLVLALARILMLLTDCAYLQLDRRFRYASIAGIQLFGFSVPNLVCLVLAFTGWGPWSLILRDLLLAAVTCGLVHWRSGYRFRGRLSRDSLRSIMAYAMPMFWARSLDVVLVRVDRFLVGTLLGNAAIGMYHQARYLAEAGLLATAPVMRLTFNLYARLQDDEPRLARACELANFVLLRVLFGGAAALVIFPAEVLRLLLGEEWLEAAPILRVLGLYAGLVPLLDNLKMLLYARALLRANLWLRIFQLAVLLPAVLVTATRGSLVGVAASLLVATAVGVAAAAYSNWDVVRRAETGVYATPLVALVTVVAAFAAWSGSAWLRGAPYWLLPFLPPLLFAVVVAGLDRGRLVRELRYLRMQFAGREADTVSAPHRTPAE
jgi:PST family polysaccharide transporter